MHFFWSPNKKPTGRRGRGRRRGGGKGKSSQGMEFLYGYMTFSWILVCFLYTNYLDMIARVFLED